MAAGSLTLILTIANSETHKHINYFFRMLLAMRYTAVNRTELACLGHLGISCNLIPS